MTTRGVAGTNNVNSPRRAFAPASSSSSNLNSSFSATNPRSLVEQVENSLQPSPTPRKRKAAAEPVDIEPVQVCLRVRPLSATEKMRDARGVLDFVDESTVQILNDANSVKYSFSHVFKEDADQATVFAFTGKNLVDALFEGKNGLLFAYGITGSGKTFTIQGTPGQNRGILTRALEEVFGRIEALKQEQENATSTGTMEVYTVTAAYMEVYNDQVYDLLNVQTQQESSRPGFVVSGREAVTVGPKRIPLAVKEDPNNKVFVKGLHRVEISSVQEGERQLSDGQKNRAVASTNINEHSSRSHAVFEIMLKRTTKTTQGFDADGRTRWVDTMERTSEMFIVDLAGSERQRKTQNSGLRLKEASCINSSLMTLGRCMETLRWNQMHPNSNPKMVPYRNSKMTRLFQGPLSGGKAYMIVNVDKTDTNIEETSNCLKYAAIARDISTVARVNTGRMLLPATPNGRSGLSAQTPMTASKLGMEFEDDEDEENNDSENDLYTLELEAKVEELANQIVALTKERDEIEVRVRQEVSEEVAGQIRDLEEQHERELANAPASMHSSSAYSSTFNSKLKSESERVAQDKISASTQGYIQELEEKTSSLSQELAELPIIKDQLRELQEKYDEAVAQRDAAVAREHEVAERLASAEHDAADSQARLEEFKAKAKQDAALASARLEDAMGRHRGEIEALNGRLAQQEARSREEIDDLRSKLDTERERSGREIAELKRKYAVMQEQHTAQLDASEQTKTAALHQVAELENAIQRIRYEVTQLNSKVAAEQNEHAQQIERMLEEKQQLEDRIAELSPPARKSMSTEPIAVFKEEDMQKREAIIVELEETREAKAAVEEQFAGAKNDLQASLATRMQLQKTVETLRAELNSVTSQLDEAMNNQLLFQKINHAMEASLKSKCDLIRVLEEKVAEPDEKTLAILDMTRQQAEKQSEDMNREISRLNMQMEQLAEAKKAAEREAAETRFAADTRTAALEEQLHSVMNSSIAPSMSNMSMSSMTPRSFNMAIQTGATRTYTHIAPFTVNPDETLNSSVYHTGSSGTGGAVSRKENSVVLNTTLTASPYGAKTAGFAKDSPGAQLPPQAPLTASKRRKVVVPPPQSPLSDAFMGVPIDSTNQRILRPRN